MSRWARVESEARVEGGGLGSDVVPAPADDHRVVCHIDTLLAARGI